MNLNLKKCSFGVEEVPFLGHLITKHGIKANPSKVKAVTDLDQPRILKDIQSLNGKLASLSRFLSKDRSGAGLMLIDPKGKEYTYALRFEFETTNNEAEYEALLAVKHVRRNQNKKVDALSKLASMTFEHLTKEVLVEVLTKRSIEEKEVLKVDTQERKSWMDPIHEYLQSGLLPEDTKEAMKIRIQAPQYKLI
ncbi:reverse transcriptase domain-containing protein [Tanacetum coccineum]|uniref:Reverse transcriptase domain-containing protein n=1 Tax=Tanacetum coccineum TaxID=301880 RepID=A0ABQ4X006_9ASTR